jgi:hypothetical protein
LNFDKLEKGVCEPKKIKNGFRGASPAMLNETILSLNQRLKNQETINNQVEEDNNSKTSVKQQIEKSLSDVAVKHDLEVSSEDSEDEGVVV